MFFIVYDQTGRHLIHAAAREPEWLVDLDAMLKDDAEFARRARRKLNFVRGSIFCLAIFLLGAACSS